MTDPVGRTPGHGQGRSTDPTYDILRSERQPLGALFRPGCVAVIGASERPGSVGRTLLWNLIRSPFGGTVYPVNPRRHSVLGVRCSASVAEIPEPVDLALIATPETGVEDFFTERDPEGWLIPSNAIDALCEALIDAKSNRARTRELGLRAAAKAQNGFSIEDYGKRARENVGKVLGF